MKRIISLLLCLSLLLSIVPAAVAVETTPPEDIKTEEIVDGTYVMQEAGLEFTVYSDHAEITGTYDTETEYDVYTVPETIDGKPVTIINRYAINLKVRKIILPDTVTTMHQGSVHHSPVQEAVMPRDLRVISNKTFNECPYLRLTFWPESITYLELIPDFGGATNAFDYDMTPFIIGTPGTIVEKLANINNCPFYPATEGVEYVTDGICACSVQNGEATYLGAYYEDSNDSPDEYIIPDTIWGFPVTAVIGTAFFGRYVKVLYLGNNVVRVEDGALSDSPISRLVTTPNLQYLPHPLFKNNDYGIIYVYGSSYAERFAKEHGYLYRTIDTVPFDDVSKDDWFFDSVYYCYQTELMNGTSLYTFNPNGTTTRAMLAKVLHNMSGAPYCSWQYGFKDVRKGDWYCEAVNWCRYYGLAYGTSDYYFSPNRNVTREQVATFLYRYAEACGFPTDGEISLGSYSDARRVSSYAKPAMSWAVSNGIINGYTPTTLKPQGYATRAEIATMLMRFVQFAEQHMEAA